MGKMPEDQLGETRKNPITGKEYIAIHAREGEKPNIVERTLIEDGEERHEILCSGNTNRTTTAP